MAHGYNGIVELEPPGEPPVDTDCTDDATREVFDAFLREQHPSLLRFFRLRVTNDEDAHDLAQESLARLLRYRGTEPARAWRPLLFRIARNLLNEQYRRGQTRHAREHVPVDNLDLPDSAPPPELMLVRHQQQAWLRDAVLQLTPRCRQVFVLSRVDGLTHAQIARRCGISLKTVEKHLATALNTLCDQAGIWTSDASA